MKKVLQAGVVGCMALIIRDGWVGRHVEQQC
jgi:hypothetical protein